jgi:hypothetical protein
MPRTTRLLVAALAFVTLSLNPLASFAGPLQEATQKIPADWLTRNDRLPRQIQGGMSCAGKMLFGLSIGAGVGLGLLTFLGAGHVDFTSETTITVPLTFGVLGSAAAYKVCRR